MSDEVERCRHGDPFFNCPSCLWLALRVVRTERDELKRRVAELEKAGDHSHACAIYRSDMCPETPDHDDILCEHKLKRCNCAWGRALSSSSTTEAGPTNAECDYCCGTKSDHEHGCPASRGKPKICAECSGLGRHTYPCPTYDWDAWKSGAPPTTEEKDET